MTWEARFQVWRVGLYVNVWSYRMPICGYVSYFPNGMISSVSMVSVCLDDDLVVSRDFWSTQTLTSHQWAHKAMLPRVQSADGWVGLLSLQVSWVGCCCVRWDTVGYPVLLVTGTQVPALGTHSFYGFTWPFSAWILWCFLLVIKWDPVQCLSWNLCSSLQRAAVGLQDSPL